MKSRSPIQAVLHVIGEKNDGGEERCQIEAHYQIKVESIKGEVAGLRSARTSVEHQMERECLHSLLWEHCLSTSN